MRTLVLGIGNILLRDEGVGVRIVEAIEQRYRLPPDVDVLDGGTAGMDLLHILAEYDQLIICDAINSNAEPGTVVTLTDDEIPAHFRTLMSPHQLGLSEVLATLKLLERGPRSVTLFGVVPEDMALGTELSPTLRTALDQVVDQVMAELTRQGTAAQITTSTNGGTDGQFHA